MDSFLPELALLPAGLHDLLPPDAEREAALVEHAMGVFRAHGYERVKPPLVEFEESFREFRFPSAERPMCCTDGPRTYVSAVLEPKLAIPASAKSGPESLSKAVPARPIPPARR